MLDPKQPNPETQVAKLKTKIAVLQQQNSELQLKVKSLKLELAQAHQRSAAFQKAYFKLARLGEALTSSKPTPPSPINN